MELKSIHPSNPVCTCNLPSLEYFEDSANHPYWSAGKVWTDLCVSNLLLVGSPHPVFSTRKSLLKNFPSEWFGVSNWLPYSTSCEFPSVLEPFFPDLIWENLGCSSDFLWNGIVWPSTKDRISVSFVRNFQFSIKFFNLLANCTFGIFLVQNKLFM